jgi:hypothetical protein
MFLRTSVLTRATRRRHIAEHSIIHCYRNENIKYYILPKCSLRIPGGMLNLCMHIDQQRGSRYQVVGYSETLILHFRTGS